MARMNDEIKKKLLLPLATKSTLPTQSNETIGRNDFLTDGATVKAETNREICRRLHLHLFNTFSDVKESCICRGTILEFPVTYVEVWFLMKPRHQGMKGIVWWNQNHFNLFQKSDIEIVTLFTQIPQP